MAKTQPTRAPFVFVLCLFGIVLSSIAYFGLTSPAVAAETDFESVVLRPAFSAPPKELAALEVKDEKGSDNGGSDKADSDEKGSDEKGSDEKDVTILLDEGRYRIDSEGRLTTVFRQIYRCLSRDSLDQNGVVSGVWSPWYQNRPTMKARVITPDGEAHALDETTIEESRIPSDQPDVFTDRKLLRAPLPALAVGCVVETEVTVTEHTPFSAAGCSDTFQTGNFSLPIRMTNIVLESPASMPLAFRVLGSDTEAVTEKKGNSRIITLRPGPLKPIVETWQSNLPSDVPASPMFAFSTVKSWRDVAKAYATIVDEQLAGSDLKKTLTAAVGSVEGKDAREIAKGIKKFVDGEIRYTSLAFGSAAIVPAKPEEVLRRGFGDCKDLSTLCVGLLRAAGVPADVALLRAGTGMAPVPQLPSARTFNHAIVRVRGNPPIWFDPTSRYVPFGELPIEDQDRLALVAAADTDAPVRTPRAEPADNRIVKKYTVAFFETLPTRLSSVCTYSGGPAAAIRAGFSTLEKDQQRDSLRESGRARFGAEKLISLSCPSTDDVEAPFRLEAEYEGALLAGVNHPRADVVLPLYEAIERLPFDLTGPADASEIVEDEDEEKESDRERTVPFVLQGAFRHELEYRVVPAPGFVPLDLPEDLSLELGPATLSVKYEKREDHSVVVKVVFDTGDGRFTPEQLKSSREKLEALSEGEGYETWQASIDFEHTAGIHLEEGRLVEAVRGYHALLQAHPDDSTQQSYFARAVLGIGLADLARTHARRAVETAPKDAYARFLLGHVLKHNRIGQHLAAGFDRAGAIEACKKSLELDPKDFRSHLNLGLLYERDDQALNRTDADALDAAIEEFSDAYEAAKEESTLVSLVAVLLERDKTAKARKWVKKAEAGQLRNILELLLLAADKKVDACFQRAVAMYPVKTERILALQHVITTLNQWRRYAAAAGIVERLRKEAPDDVNLRRSVKVLELHSRYDLNKAGDTSPTEVVKSVLATAFAYGPGSLRLSRFYADAPPEPVAAFESELPVWFDEIRGVLLTNDFSGIRLADSVGVFAYEQAEGSETCCRVLVTYKVVSGLTWTATVVRTEDGFRLVRAGRDYGGFGRKALELLKEGNEEDARRLLIWAYKAGRPQGGLLGMFNHFAASPFRKLWTFGNETKDDLRLAAAALAAQSDSPEEAARVLAEMRPNLSASKHLHVDRALATAYLNTGLFDKLAEVAGRLHKQHPTALEPASMVLAALESQSDPDAVEEFLKQCKGIPGIGFRAKAATAKAAIRKGDTDRAASILAELARRSGGVPACERRGVVWSSLALDPVPENTLALAAEAVNQTTSEPPNNRMTAAKAARRLLVLAQIEAGRIPEAVQSLYTIPRVDPERRPSDFDRLALGWIAEKCGLTEHAAELYKQVRPGRGPDAATIHELAQRRLERLQSPKRETP